MPEYRPLREGEVILEGDKFSMVNGVPVDMAVSGIGHPQGYCNITYYRVSSSSQTKTPPNASTALFDALKELLALGYNQSFPKWSQWEEIVLAQELIDGISNKGWRELKNSEFIKLGDQHNGRRPRMD